MLRIEVVHPGPDLLGEAPQWHAGEQRLYWVDAFAPAIRRIDAAGHVQSFALPFDIGSFVFAAGGALVAATRRGFQRIGLEGGQAPREPLAGPRHGVDAPPDIGVRDGRIGAAGPAAGPGGRAAWGPRCLNRTRTSHDRKSRCRPTPNCWPTR